MKIFISWSGQKSKKFASVFKEWIPSVIQAVKPYFSPSDIDKGARWASEIAKELEDCQIGLIFLTNDNLEAPWLTFEAGALSKIENARVCTLLFGVEPTDIKGPLAQFQATRFIKAEVHKLIETINDKLSDELKMDSKTIGSVFEKWWPELNENIQSILNNTAEENEPELRSDRDLLEEILGINRVLSARDFEGSLGRSEHNLSSQALSELIDRHKGLTLHFALNCNDVEALKLLYEHNLAVFPIMLNPIPDGFKWNYNLSIGHIMDELAKRIKTLDSKVS